MFKRIKYWVGFLITVSLLLLAAIPVMAAYKAHNADRDAELFLKAYPLAEGTKLDNCYLCHTGGKIGKKSKDSCDYCHEVYGFKPPHGDVKETLNSFGKAYMDAGRNESAFTAIAKIDSDGDGYTNEEEILAGHLPGDKNDNPGVEEAPAVVYTREKLRSLPKTTQFMAVDTSKSGDFFAEYAGVSVWDLLQDAGVSEDATDVTVFASDGYSKTYSIKDIKTSYEQGKFYKRFPWISLPLQTSYADGQQLPGSLCYLLAYEREGYPLQESKIIVEDGRSHMDGEGPYRFVAPLAEPVVPDRSAWSIDRADPPYPYNPDRPAVRNGDYCVKGVVAIRVNTGTNSSYHYDWSGRAWEMIEKGELVVYGAIDPE